MTLQLHERHQQSTAPLRIGWLLLAVLLVALNLRIGITSVGALLEEVEHTVGLSAFTTSFLTSLPVLCFAVVGATGIAVTRRFGVHRGLTIALALLVLGLGLRVTDGPVVLLLGTFLGCAGIALANVLMPSVVKSHFPTRIGEVTGAYSAVLSVGAALGAALTVPVADAAGSWRAGLGVWAVLAVLALVTWLPYSRRPDAATERPAAGSMLRSPLAWAVTMLFATQSLFAYVLMSWLPSMYTDAGFTDHEAGLLLAGSIIVGVPVYFVAPTLATRLRSQGHLIAVLTGLVALGFAGLWLAPLQGAWLWAALLGAGGAVFPVTLTLFALRTRNPAETARLSSMAQSIGYLVAAAGPFSVGLLHDATGSWSVPLSLLVLVCIGQIGLGYAAGRPGFTHVAEERA